MKKLIFLLFLSFTFSIASYGKIQFLIIGEDEKPEISELLKGLKEYIPEFNYKYYYYQAPVIKEFSKMHTIAYLPFVVYNQGLLKDEEMNWLRKKKLIIKDKKLYLFPRRKLIYLTKVKILGRERIPNELGVFTMSFCPYGKRAIWRLIKYIRDNKLSIKLKLYFIAEVKDEKIISMHGPDELEEDIHQIIIQKYWPNKLYKYLLLLETKGRFEAIKEAGISYRKLDSLRKKGKKLLRENIKVAQRLGIYASPTFLWENTYLVGGINNIIKVLEEKKKEIYEATHPAIKYLIIAHKEENFEVLLKHLKQYFQLKGEIISYDSAQANYYIKQYKIDYLPILLVKTKDKKASDILENKLKWRKVKDGFLMPETNLLEFSALYLPERKRKPRQLDIIANAKTIRRIQNSSFVQALKQADVSIIFHKYSFLHKPLLYKEIKIKALPSILWENQYLATDFRKLLTISSFRNNFKGLKLNRKILIDYFYSPACKHCKYIDSHLLPSFLRKYGNIVEFIKFDTTDDKNYEFLLKMEKFYNFNRSGIPKIFIGDKVLIGKSKIKNNLEVETLATLISGKKMFGIPPSPVKVYYFYQKDAVSYTAKAQNYIEQYLFPKLIIRYPNRIKLLSYEITSSQFKELPKAIKGAISTNNPFPQVYIAGEVISGKIAIIKNIDRMIQEELIALSRPAEAEENVLFSRLLQFTIPAIVGAGLMDGINPCAFTVMIFFISFLTMAGYKKDEMIWVGSFFIFAVFLTYLLIGLGLFSAFYKLAIYRTLADIFRYIIIIVVFILAFFNLYDFIIYKLKKKPSSVVLQLPQRIKFLIQKTIGKGYRIEKDRAKKGIWKLIVTALIVGFAVSILESICTGQLYFPTIAFIAQLPRIMKLKAISYLILYNLMFIVPLIVIFLLGLIGVTSQQFAAFIKKHLGKIKLLTALVFFFLAYILIVFF